jgi:hypothetical protein
MNPVLRAAALRPHRRTEFIPALLGFALAPNRALLGKLAERLGKNRPRSGGKWRNWRFFKGPKRHFAVLTADDLGSQAANPPDITSLNSGCPQPPATRQIGDRALFFVCQWSVVICHLSADAILDLYGVTRMW